jgi:hypothetical protein
MCLVPGQLALSVGDRGVLMPLLAARYAPTEVPISGCPLSFLDLGFWKGMVPTGRIHISHRLGSSVNSLLGIRTSTWLRVASPHPSVCLYIQGTARVASGSVAMAEDEVHKPPEPSCGPTRLALPSCYDCGHTLP